MSGGSLFLVDHCDVLRYTVTAQAYGSKRTPEPHLSDVPCRLVIKEQKGFNSVTGEWMKDTDYTLLTLPDVDIEEGDRVTNVRMHNDTLDQLLFEVDGGALKRRGRMATHRRMKLKRIE